MTLNFWGSRSFLVALVAALAAIFVLPQTCFACSCLPPKPPLEAAADAAAVFQGRVTKVEQVRGSTGAESKRVTMQVSKVWKGNVTAETLVYTANDSAACGISFQQGTEYIVYASVADGTDVSGTPANSFVTGLCDRTSPIAEASDDLAALGPGQPPTPAMPNTGGGATDAGASSRVIPAELLIGGAVLAVLAVIWRGRVSRRMVQG